jgi:trehalose/maltose hydrolase-like predicted phosphorylase
MTAVQGFGGVRIDDKGISIKPRLCPQWRALEFKLVHLGDSFRVRIEKGAVTLTAAMTNARRRRVSVADKVVFCPPGVPVVVPYRSVRR